MRYEYECKSCSKNVEFVFPTYVSIIGLEKKCPHCGSTNLKRIWNVPFVKYVGNGFYNNDKNIKK